jgi:hypothetical protein
MPVILATQKAEIRRIGVQTSPGQIIPKTLSQKYPTQKRPHGVAQAVRSTSKCEALSSKPQCCQKKDILLFVWILGFIHQYLFY